MSIDVHYFSFSPERADKLWLGFAGDLAQAKAGAKFDMYRDPLASLANPRYIRDEADILTNLKFLDLNYGSVHCQPLDDGKLEYFLVEVLAKTTGLELTTGETPREDWIKLYSQINNEFIEKTTALLAQKRQWIVEESRQILLDFIHNVHPIVKDLNQNTDSLFIYYADTSDEVSPDSAEQLLTQRAREHSLYFHKISG